MLTFQQNGLSPFPDINLPEEVSTTAGREMRILCRYCDRSAYKISGSWWHEVARGGDNGQYEPCAAGKLRNAIDSSSYPFNAEGCAS